MRLLLFLWLLAVALWFGVLPRPVRRPKPAPVVRRRWRWGLMLCVGGLTVGLLVQREGA